MPKSLIFLDIDGTLVDSGEIPTSALAALKGARANGHKLFINTGRPFCMLDVIRGQFEFDGYCCSAGTYVKIADEQLVYEPMGKEVARRLIDLLNTTSCDYNVECPDKRFLRMSDDVAVKLEAMNSGGSFLEAPSVDAMKDRDYGDVFKVSLLSSEGDLELLGEKLESCLDLTDYGFAYEVTNAQYTKGTAIAEVSKHYPGYRTIAFGDSDNDIPMFEAADVAVCMGNGTEATKAAADMVTLDVDKDGLAAAFKQLELIVSL